MDITIERIDMENVKFALQYLLNHYEESGYQVSTNMIQFTLDKVNTAIENLQIDSMKRSSPMVYPTHINWKGFTTNS